MRLAAPRRPALPFLALLLLMSTLAAPGLALARITDVSKERAKELGITVRSRPSANNDLWIQVEFKTTGSMQEFRYANLDLTRGEKRLVTAPLRPRKPARNSAPEDLLLEFYIDPAALPNASVTIFVYHAPLSGIGYRLDMQEFLAQAPSR